MEAPAAESARQNGAHAGKGAPDFVAAERTLPSDGTDAEERAPALNRLKQLAKDRPEDNGYRFNAAKAFLKTGDLRSAEKELLETARYNRSFVLPAQETLLDLYLQATSSTTF